MRRLLALVMFSIILTSSIPAVISQDEEEKEVMHPSEFLSELETRAAAARKVVTHGLEGRYSYISSTEDVCKTIDKIMDRARSVSGALSRIEYLYQEYVGFEKKNGMYFGRTWKEFVDYWKLRREFWRAFKDKCSDLEYYSSYAKEALAYGECVDYSYWMDRIANSGMIVTKGEKAGEKSIVFFHLGDCGPSDYCVYIDGLELGEKYKNSYVPVLLPHRTTYWKDVGPYGSEETEILKEVFMRRFRTFVGEIGKDDLVGFLADDFRRLEEQMYDMMFYAEKRIPREGYEYSKEDSTWVPEEMGTDYYGIYQFMDLIAENQENLEDFKMACYSRVSLAVPEVMEFRAPIKAVIGFDVSHEQEGLVEHRCLGDLSRKDGMETYDDYTIISTIARKHGYLIVPHTERPLKYEDMKKYDVFIMPALGRVLDDREVDEVKEFVKNGGKLVRLAEKLSKERVEWSYITEGWVIVDKVSDRGVLDPSDYLRYTTLHHRGFDIGLAKELAVQNESEIEEFRKIIVPILRDLVGDPKPQEMWSIIYNFNRGEKMTWGVNAIIMNDPLVVPYLGTEITTIATGDEDSTNGEIFDFPVVISIARNNGTVLMIGDTDWIKNRAFYMIEKIYQEYGVFFDNAKLFLNILDYLTSGKVVEEMPYSLVKIGDIINNPEAYKDKLVMIEGEVSEILDLYESKTGNFYQRFKVNDGTGEILVFMWIGKLKEKKVALNIGQKVRVIGLVSIYYGKPEIKGTKSQPVKVILLEE